MSRAIPDDYEGRYRHYKGGLYRVIGYALHSETHEPMIIYVSEGSEVRVWVRPADMFFETVTIDGRDQPRFRRLGA